MDIALFREHFARIPRHVVILATKEKNSIYGVTISSLQSVSIDEDTQILTFVLGKNSSFSEKLINNGQLSINFLGSKQAKIGELYSSKSRTEITNSLDDIWVLLKNGLVHLKGAPLCISGTLIDILEMQNSNIYFVSANEILKTNKFKMLLYGDRLYGSFKASKVQQC